MTKQKIPKVRFDGFNNYWEMKKMSELVKLINGRAYKQSELLDSGRYRVLRVGNFNTNDKWYYSNLELEENKYAEEGDLLYLWATNFGPEIWKEERVIYHYHIWKIVYDESVVGKEYLYSWLESDKERIQQNTNGSTMVHITKSMMEDRTLNKPMSLSEQSQIGSLFSAIDSLLSSYKYNLENYQAFKKSMLSKMFPKNGHTVPEIRLDGFEGEWATDRADILFKSVSSKGHPELPVLSASQVDGMVLRDSIGIDIKYDKTSLSNYKVVKPNQFVIHLRSFQGGFALSRIEGITSPAYTVLDFINSQNHHSLFWSNIFTSNNFIKQLETVTYGIRDGKSISFSDFSSLKFMYPSLEEQRAIGAFFSNLDDLISSYQTKIDELELLKKKLLQDMFV